VQVINYYHLDPAELVAVIVPFRDEIPFDGPHAYIFDGVRDEFQLGDMAFRTMAFVDLNTLIETLHAAGIHVHVNSDFEFVKATAGPAAGEPDVPKIEAPPIPEPAPQVEPEIDPDQGSLALDPPSDETIVAGPQNT